MNQPVRKFSAGQNLGAFFSRLAQSLQKIPTGGKALLRIGLHD
jgi:DNA-directed RNA polymerase subunit N (RpoN/RPB10)